jgi:hypothetical protein
MAPDDRDSIFEKALERHLRLSGSGPRVPEQSGSSDAACPNPEVLAAYHERLLAPEQMLWFKQHLAGCDRCQEILATLEATDDLLLPSDSTAEELQNVVTMPAPHVEIPAEIVTATAATGPVAVPSRAARRAQSSWRSKTLRGAKWRWLAPAGAIAASLLLWVSFHESRPSSFELAKTMPSAATPVATSAPKSPAPSQQSADLGARENSQPPGSAPAGGQLADALNRDASGKNERAKAAETNLDKKALEEKRSVSDVAGKPVAPRRDTSAAIAGANQGVVSAAPQLDRDAAPDTTASEQDGANKPARKQSAAPAAQSTSRTPSSSIRDTKRDTKDESRLEQSESVAPAKSEPVAKAKAAPGRQAPQEQERQQVAGNIITLQATQSVAPGQDSRMLRVAKMSASNVIAAPNSQTLWRVAPAGIIEYSSDAGATWTIQPSGVVIDLLAGSAPSATVCWIVGRAGTLIRTTDAGSHWQKLNAPTTDDLTSVFAVNPQQATVSTTIPLRSYRTTDAGKSWTQLPNP